MQDLPETVPLWDIMCQWSIYAYCASFGWFYALGVALGAICAQGHALTFKWVYTETSSNIPQKSAARRLCVPAVDLEVLY